MRIIKGKVKLVKDNTGNEKKVEDSPPTPVVIPTTLRFGYISAEKLEVLRSNHRNSENNAPPPWSAMSVENVFNSYSINEQIEYKEVEMKKS